MSITGYLQSLLEDSREVTRETYEKHTRKHTGEEPYQCGICAKRYVQVGSVAIHMTRHTEEMLYKCQDCGKRFTVKQQLRLHSRMHRGIKNHTLVTTVESPLLVEVSSKFIAEKKKTLLLHQMSSTVYLQSQLEDSREVTQE